MPPIYQFRGSILRSYYEIDSMTDGHELQIFKVRRPTASLVCLIRKLIKRKIMKNFKKNKWYEMLETACSILFIPILYSLRGEGKSLFFCNSVLLFYSPTFERVVLILDASNI